MDAGTRGVAAGVALGGLAVLGAISGILLVILLREILAVIFLGFIVGITLLPVTEGARRWHIPRVVTVLGVYLLIAGLLALFLWYAIPTVSREAQALIERIVELEQWYAGLAFDSGLPTVEDLEEYARERADAIIPGIAQQLLLIVTVLAYVLVIFVVAMFVTITHQSMRATVLTIMAPRYRARTDAFLSVLGSKLRHYVFATFLKMTVVGMATYIGLTLIGIPLAFLLAVLAFAFEVLPILGPWLAYIPALLVALSQGVFDAIAVSIFYLLLQQFESYVLVPVIYGHETRVPGLLLLVTILIGLALMGVLGALVALPISIMLYTFIVEIVLPWRRGQLEVTPLPITLPDEEPERLARNR